MKDREFQFFSVRLWNGTSGFEPGLYPFCVEEAEREHPKTFRCSGQDFLVAAFLLSGGLCYRFRTGKLLLVPGEILLIPPHTPYEFSGAGAGGYRKLVFEISGKYLEQELYALNLNRVIHRKCPDFPERIAAVREIGEGMADIPAHFAVLVGKTVEFLYSLREPEESKPSRLFAFAQNAVEELLSVPVDLNVLERRLRVSRSTLGRLFRSEAGISPREYWIRRKIHRAKYYLSCTDLSIKEIAYRLGYSSQFHFSGEFRKRLCLSPTEFRKNHSVPE